MSLPDGLKVHQLELSLCQRTSLVEHNLLHVPKQLLQGVVSHKREKQMSELSED